jgi:glutathione peroxidase
MTGQTPVRSSTLTPTVASAGKAHFNTGTYGTAFPMTGKLEVNGRRRHPLYQRLTAIPDATGEAGEVEWNFEKFLVAPSGEVLARFRPTVAPEDERIVERIERALR